MIAGLEFELTYFDVTIQRINHYTREGTLPLCPCLFVCTSVCVCVCLCVHVVITFLFIYMYMSQYTF